MKSQHKVVLSQANFRRLLLARTISNFGNGMAPTALAFSIFALPDGDATSLSLVLTAQAIPLVIMLPLGGVLADRIGRARMIAIMDTILSIVVFAEAYLFWNQNAFDGNPPIILLVILSAISGVLNALWYPAYPGLPADLLDDEYLQTANSYISFGSNASIIFGAAAGGFLVSQVSGAFAIAVDGLTFLIAGLLVWKLRHTSSRATESESVIKELHDGWKVFWSYKWVVVVVACFSLVVMAMRATDGVLGPLVAKDEFDGAITWAQIISMEGIGLLVGAVIATKWRPSRPIVMSMFATYPIGIYMLFLSVPTSLTTLLGIVFFMGIGLELMWIWWSTALQSNIPKESIGRVAAYDAFGSTLFGPIGLALAGPLAESFGPRPVLIGAGSLVILMVTLSFLSKDVRNLRGAGFNA
ncbi:MAG: MFS transporter [Actinobacteria bacterium]|nr:MFS transporter [Actinomycetota bacterium]